MHDFSQLVAQYGLALVFANVMLDQLGFPAPAFPALMVAGALAADGRLSAPEIFAVSVLATLIADSVWYVAGRRYGSGVMKMLCRVSLTPDLCVSQTQVSFERWGANALVIAKFIPGLAVIAPPLAGATGIGWTRFLILSTLGASLWVGAGLGAGLILKEQIEYFLGFLERAGAVALIILGLLFAAYVSYKWWERYRFFRMLRMARISVDELYRLMGVGENPLIFDVRSEIARELEPRRIPGALQVPLGAVDQHVKDLPRDRDIILYCTCPNEVSAAEAARLLMNNGFKRVRPLHGGLDAWIAAGHAVEEIRGGT